MAAEEEELVVLRCFDGAEVAAPASNARQSSGLVGAATAVDGSVVVDVPGNVSGRAIAAVVAYWEGRAAAADAREFDGGFLGGLGHDARVDLIHAAYHLADDGLLALFVKSFS